MQLSLKLVFLALFCVASTQAAQCFPKECGCPGQFKEGWCTADNVMAGWCSASAENCESCYGNLCPADDGEVSMTEVDGEVDGELVDGELDGELVDGESTTPLFLYCFIEECGCPGEFKQGWCGNLNRMEGWCSASAENCAQCSGNVCMLPEMTALEVPETDGEVDGEVDGELVVIVDGEVIYVTDLELNILDGEVAVDGEVDGELAVDGEMMVDGEMINGEEYMVDGEVANDGEVQVLIDGEAIATDGEVVIIVDGEVIPTDGEVVVMVDGEIIATDGEGTLVIIIGEENMLEEATYLYCFIEDCGCPSDFQESWCTTANRQPGWCEQSVDNCNQCKGHVCWLPEFLTDEVVVPEEDMIVGEDEVVEGEDGVVTEEATYLYCFNSSCGCPDQNNQFKPEAESWCSVDSNDRGWCAQSEDNCNQCEGVPCWLPYF